MKTHKGRNFRKKNFPFAKDSRFPLLLYFVSKRNHTEWENKIASGNIGKSWGMRKVVTKTLREFKNGMLLAGVCVHVCADAGWCKKRDGTGSKIYQMFMYRRVEKNKIGKRFLKFNNDFVGWVIEADGVWRICRGRIKSMTTWYGPLKFYFVTPHICKV